jgi:serine/threonine protein kinase
MIELPIRVATPDVSHVDALACGTRLGEFEILGLIGVGGFGMVYRAYDHSLHRDVAIKEYMPTALAGRTDNVLNISVRNSNDQETFQKGLRSFVDEARMLAKFEHPSLVRVFRFWEANDTAYMVMPLYRGVTLNQARQSMRLPPTEAWLRKVLWSILGALRVLHRGKALHRDVSPDNIFLQDAGPPVLLDLGAARFAIGDNARQHTAILKVNYAPIEQYADAHGLPQGPWTDLYALAAVVHGLLCNEAPLPSMVRVVHDDMPAFGKVVKTVAAEFGQSYSEQFANGIAWALQIQPQDRPQSVREFARALGIETPHGMSTFDWRAELGPASLPAGDVLRLSAAPTVEDKTRSNQNTPDYAPTQFINRDDDPDTDVVATVMEQGNSGEAPPRPYAATAERKAHSRPPPRAERPAPARSPPAGKWIVFALIALSLLVATAWAWRSASTRAKAVTPPLSSAPAAAASSAPGSSAITSGTAALLETSPASAASASASIARPATATSNAADKAAKAGERIRNTGARTVKVEAPQTPPATPTPGAPAPVEAPTPQPEPKPVAPVVTPEKLCADSNFLTRPMCLYRACQRPDLSGTATCVALEQNLKRSAEVDKH